MTPEAISQVQFTSAPRPCQLFPRQSNDSSDVVISGSIAPCAKTKVVFRLFRMGAMIDSLDYPLNFNSGNFQFNHAFRIKAERAEYKVSMSLTDAQSETFYLTADSLVSGDVFIVNGQSNGAGPSQGPGADPLNEWVRTFGTASTSDIDCAKDTLWGLGIANLTQNNHALGVWSARLGKLLSDSLQIPICIINGSKFGSGILSHLPSSSNVLDLKTIYGRLLFRAQKAGVAQHARALFWYQGESNGDTSYQQYSTRFQALYNSWKIHFPALSRIFVIQTRPGCITGSSFVYHQYTREILRKLPQSYPDITLMSSAGIPNFDGCHFLSSGYLNLASHLYHLVRRDVYNAPVPASIDPPQIVSASFANASRTILALRMSDPVFWPSPLNGNDLKDYFYFPDAGLSVLSGWTSADTVYLLLNRPALTPHVSYLPNIYYNGSATAVFQGPWLLNQRGLGAFAFHQFPIDRSFNLTVTGTTSLCAGDSSLVHISATGLSIQWKLNGFALSGKTDSLLWVSQPGIYTASLMDVSGNVVASQQVQFTTGAPAVANMSSSATQICPGGMVTIEVDSSLTATWSTGQTTQAITVTSPGWYHVIVSAAGACASSDSLYIAQAQVPLADLLHGSLSACNGDSVLLRLAGGETGVWSNGSTDSAVYVKNAGYYSAIVTNSQGCSKASDTVFVDIIQTPVSIQPSGALSICSNQKINLTAVCSSATAYQWLNNGTILSGATTAQYKPLASGNYAVVIEDVFGCTSASPIVPVTIRFAPAATFTISNQYDNCRDTVATLTANSGSGLLYQWYNNNSIIPGATSRVFTSNSAGNYKVMVTNPWGCTKISGLTSIPVAFPIASLTVQGSSVICNGDSVLLQANSGAGLSYQWLRNNASIAGANSSSYYVKRSGFYKVNVTNTMGCSALSSGRSISVSPCTSPLRSSAENLEASALLVYPNPASDILGLQLIGSSDWLGWEILDMMGHVLLRSSDERLPGDVHYSIVVSGLQSGSYIVRCITSEGVLSNRFELIR